MTMEWSKWGKCTHDCVVCGRKTHRPVAIESWYGSSPLALCSPFCRTIFRQSPREFVPNQGVVHMADVIREGARTA